MTTTKAEQQAMAELREKAIDDAKQLNGDHLHVLLDLVSHAKKTGYWSGGYDSDPADDLKASEQGWKALLSQAELILIDQLNRA